MEITKGRKGINGIENRCRFELRIKGDWENGNEQVLGLNDYICWIGISKITSVSHSHRWKYTSDIVVNVHLSFPSILLNHQTLT